jgi:hypothetical protein
MTLLMTPGPNEPTGDELQEFSRLIVDDLEAFQCEPITVGHSVKRPNGTYCVLRLLSFY